MVTNIKLTNTFKQIVELAKNLLQEKDSIVIAIDGRCAAGKTTLAQLFAQYISCPVIPMDDFFLQPEQRTRERMEIPGNNIDYERFMNEVIIPLRERREFSYCPYDCITQTFKEPIFVKPNKIMVVEGVYSCRPEFWHEYDIHVFLDVNKRTQRERILNRSSQEVLDRFEELWIPLEEKYFEEYNIQDMCELVYTL